MRVAFQGEPGAYSEQAVIEHFGKEAETVPCKIFDIVFDRVNGLDCDYGMLPIENSLAGSIHQNYDLLLQNKKLSIVGEHYLRVEHCLVALPDVKKEEIHRVISHPQGLAQCAGYLRGMSGVRIEASHDTAGSVRIVKESGDRQTAAIASRRASEIHQMQILEEGIEDNRENYTRFLVISARPDTPEGECKTSIVFQLKNQPGALFKALSVFALRDIDLTKIESRPIAGQPWDYMFYIDFLGSAADEPVKRAVDHLGEYASTLRVLGSYLRHVYSVN
ncbi:MAG: prephenate dehydratase [Anaerolineales bacterium]|nr:prephenate dehydratase [Anaerolineales bacterium]